MIVLQATNAEQRFNIIANIDEALLPLDGVVFRFRNVDDTINVTGSLDKNGFRQTATITVDLRDGEDYDLTVLNGNTEIYRDTVFVTNQDIDTFSINEGDFTYFNFDDNRAVFVDGSTIIDIDQDTLVFPYEGATMSLVINAIGDFTVADNTGFLTYTASGSGNTNLSITASRNIGEFRTGVLQVVSDGITRNIRVDQLEKPIPGYIRNSPEVVGSVDQVLSVNTTQDGLLFTDLPEAIRGLFNVQVFRGVATGTSAPARPTETLYDPSMDLSTTNGIPTGWTDDEGDAGASDPTMDVYTISSGIVDPNVVDANGLVTIHWGVVHEISAVGPAGATGPGYSSITDNMDGTFTFNGVHGATSLTTIDLTGDQGEQGIQGFQGRMVFSIYRNHDGTPPRPGDSRYVQDTGVLSNIPTDWSIIPPDLDGTRYRADFILNPVGNTNNLVDVDWGEPFIDASEGPQGIGISSITNDPNDANVAVIAYNDPSGATPPMDDRITLPRGAAGMDGENVTVYYASSNTGDNASLIADNTLPFVTFIDHIDPITQADIDNAVWTRYLGEDGNDFAGVRTVSGGTEEGEATVIQPQVREPNGAINDVGGSFTVQAGQRGERGPAGAGATIQVLNDNMVVHATGGSFEQFNFNDGITASQNQNNLEEVDINIDPIQAVADQNTTNQIMYWYGTQAELQALIDGNMTNTNTLYTTTDDANLSVLNEGTGLTTTLGDGRYGSLADVIANNAKLGLPIPDAPGSDISTDPSADSGDVPVVQDDGTYVLESLSAVTFPGLTATVAELNFSDGVTSSIQGQIDALPTDAELDLKADANNPSLTGTKSLDNGVFRVLVDTVTIISVSYTHLTLPTKA